MKKIFFLAFILTQSIIAQKTYDFDYILEYKNEIDSTKLISNPTYIVNSKANNYFILTYKKDSLNNGFDFGEKEGKKRPRVFATVNTKELYETGTITIGCDAVFYDSEYPYKNLVKDYYFENLKDTIINNISYYHYAIKNNKSIKYQRRKNIHTYHYIVDKEHPFFLPFFVGNTVYEEWKTDKKIPNGILKIRFYENWKNEITQKWVLNKIIKTEKILIIPENCDKLKP